MANTFGEYDTFFTNKHIFDVSLKFETLNSEEPLHSHNYKELILVVDGEGILQINGITIEVPDGSLLYLQPIHVHSLSPKGKFVSFYKIEFSVAMALYLNVCDTEKIDGVFNTEYSVPIVTLSEDDAVFLISFLDRYINSHSNFQNLVNISIISALISTFKQYALPIIKDMQIKDQPIAWKALSYMSVNYYKDLNLTDVAALVDASGSQLNSALKLLSGMSFAQVLNLMRVTSSESMMQFTNLSTKQISRLVGFKNDASFYKQFKQLRNENPNRYRQNHFTSANYLYDDDALSIFQYVLANYKKDITLGQVADFFNFSEKYVNSQLEENFKYNFSELVNYLRTVTATGLLLSSDFSISEIANIIGYKDERTFAKNFKIQFNTTPSKYRQSKNQEKRHIK